MRRLCVIVVAAIWMGSVHDVLWQAVNARFTVDNGSPLIGQAVQLTLRVEALTGITVHFPEFPADWPPFTVKRVGDIKTAQNGDRVVYQQTLVVIPWQTGDFQTPRTTIAYQLAGSSDTIQMVAQPAFFSISSVLTAQDETIRPFKPPVYLPYFSPLLVGIALVVGAMGLGGMVWWRHRRRLSLQPVASISQFGHLHVAARMALSALQQVESHETNLPQVYDEASGYLRQYVMRRFEMPSEQMTTVELMRLLQHDSRLTERRQHELRHLLEQADLVKFAGLRPEPKHGQRFLMIARRWVEAVEQQIEAGDE